MPLMEETRRLIAKPDLAETVRRQGRLQTWLASLIGKDNPYITHMIKGRRSITIQDAERITLALGVVDVFLLFDFAPATTVVASEVPAA